MIVIRAIDQNQISHTELRIINDNPYDTSGVNNYTYHWHNGEKKIESGCVKKHSREQSIWALTAQIVSQTDKLPAFKAESSTMLVAELWPDGEEKKAITIGAIHMNCDENGVSYKIEDPESSPCALAAEGYIECNLAHDLWQAAKSMFTEMSSNNIISQPKVAVENKKSFWRNLFTTN